MQQISSRRLTTANANSDLSENDAITLPCCSDAAVAVESWQLKMARDNAEFLWEGMWERNFESGEGIHMPRVVGINRLSTLQCKTAVGPCVLEDGGGLRLVVSKGGNRSWVLRASVGGKRRDFGLGAFDAVPLKVARERAVALRQEIQAGGPIEPPASVQRRRSAASRTAPIEARDESLITVRSAFQQFWRIKKPQLENRKHAAQWETTLDTYAFPLIGEMPVADVDTKSVATLLEPIWREKPETAQRVQQRLKMIFDFAIASGYRTAGNPTLAVKMILGERNHRPSHHRALAYTKMPDFLAQLRARGETACGLAFEWLVLTATRSSETRLALASEIDVGKALWTIPAERTKMRRDHEVPLSRRCLEIHGAARRLWPHSPLLFPSEQGHRRHLSENTFQEVLKSMSLHDVATAHGMRSSFRDWAAECARARHEVAEASLGHLVRDKVVAAYLRTSFFEERRALMTQWSDYCAGGA